MSWKGEVKTMKQVILREEKNLLKEWENASIVKDAHD